MKTFPVLAPALTSLREPTIELVQTWLHDAAANPHGQNKAAELLAKVLKDPQGLDFTLGFVDRVVRPEDNAVAAHELRRLAKNTPSFLPWYLKTAVRLGGALAPVFPGIVVPTSRRILRAMVSHLIVDARPTQLTKAISALRSEDTRLNINLLGEAVLGDAEADARLQGTKDLLERDDVDYVSIKVSSVVAQVNLWAFEDTVAEITKRLRPLYEYAAASTKRGNTKFINLDMEEYHDLDLTIAVFKTLLQEESLRDLEAGIVLQAYLPDALGALQDLTEFAKERQAHGGAGIKVRVVKGANLPMEVVDAKMHGWALATVNSKQEADTNYKRVLDWALRPENAAAVRIGVAGHNVFDIALAYLLAQARGVSERVEFEMLLGMAESQAKRIRQDVGSVLLYTPVVHPGHFDVAISYLVRRLEENASSENFMSAIFEMDKDPALFQREKERFEASLAAANTSVPEPHRHQDLNRIARDQHGHFANQQDSDPSLPQVRQWAAEIFERMPHSELGEDILADSTIDSQEQVEQLIDSAVQAGTRWGQRSTAARAQVLRKAAESLAAARGELIEVAGHETGKTLAEGDVEVSEAIDFANYYADLAEDLDTVQGATFVPSALSVVTPPWNFPIAITTGSVLAPLAAGSAVIIKPAPQARRTAAVMIQALWDSGIPKELLRLADIAEGPVAQHLIAHPLVDRVILTGAYETAQLFKSWRSDMFLLAETSGKNAIVVTPSTDLDLAAADVVKSAFSHAGQKCSAASLAIMLGSAAHSQRFMNQLIDAASSLVVAYPDQPNAEMGPIVEPAHGKLKGALTELGEGERWLLEPQQLDESGRLWSPGIRTGVQPGSYFHTTEFFGPVLGIMQAKTLEEAIEIQNGTDYGLTAGIHSMDPEQVNTWLEKIQAGNVYINRGITGAIVRRQPFGGWKRSSIGPGAKAGGPNYLMHLGSWRAEDVGPDAVAGAAELSPGIQAFLTGTAGTLPDEQARWLELAAQLDQLTWEQRFGIRQDVSGVQVERNEFRYVPTEVLIRSGANAAATDVYRMVLAGLRAGADIQLSVAEPPEALCPALESLTGEGHTVHYQRESDLDFAQRMREMVQQQPRELPERIRLIGSGSHELADILAATPEVAIYAGPVTQASRVEMLPFVIEQAISITAHRFGNPDPVVNQILPA